MKKGDLAAILVNTMVAVEKDPSKANAIFRVRVESLDGVKSVVTAQSSNPMSFGEEAGPNLGLGCTIEHAGHEVGMVPGEMYLASIGSCLVTGLKVFADMLDLAIDRATVDVTGYTDLRGVLDMDPSVPIGFGRIEYQVSILCDGDTETINKLISIADCRCPVLDMARNASEITGSYNVNRKSVTLDPSLV